MPANLNKSVDFANACMRAWDWLQTQAEYKKDLLIQKKEIESGELPDFPDNQSKCEADCRCDKRNPGLYYSAKGKRWFSQKQFNWKLRNDLRNKWLFYPLSAGKRPSSEFIQGLEELAWQTRRNVLDSAVKIFDKDLWESFLKNSTPSMIRPFDFSKQRLNSEEIYIRIFMKASDAQIINELKEILKDKRNKSGIKEMRPQFKNLDKTYIGKISKSIGYKLTAIAVECDKDIQKKNLTYSSINKARKRLYRAMKSQ